MIGDPLGQEALRLLQARKRHFVRAAPAAAQHGRRRRVGGPAQELHVRQLLQGPAIAPERELPDVLRQRKVRAMGRQRGHAGGLGRRAAGQQRAQAHHAEDRSCRDRPAFHARSGVGGEHVGAARPARGAHLAQVAREVLLGPDVLDRAARYAKSKAWSGSSSARMSMRRTCQPPQVGVEGRAPRAWRSGSAVRASAQVVSGA
jgi:hypothetical protein